jgi:hypothetical protein
MLLGQDLQAHIAHAKVRVSTSMKLSKTAQFNLDSILSYNSTFPARSSLAKK